MQIVGEDERRSTRPEGTVCGLEDLHGLAARHVVRRIEHRERPQKVGGRSQRHLPLGLVAGDAEQIR